MTQTLVACSKVPLKELTIALRDRMSGHSYSHLPDGETGALCCRFSWPMIKSTLDGSHAWLTLTRTLWKHALAWGCLSPINNGVVYGKRFHYSH